MKAEMMKKIKIGQIGIGHNHGSEKMRALRAHPEVFEVVGVTEPDPSWREKRGNLDVYQGLPFLTEEELYSIPGLEAVAVETDGKELIPAALRAAERGVHIHLDKPGGESLPEFRKLTDLCKERALALQLAYVYRYNPAVQFCVDAVRKGWLGDVFEIHAVMSRWDGDEYRTWLSQFHGGAMYIFAGYLIDLVLQMLGEPQKVTPFMKKTRADGLVDNGLAVMEYPRATATIRVSVDEVDGMKHRRLIVCGTNGTFELCPIEFTEKEYRTRSLMPRLTLKEPCGGFEAGTRQVDLGPMGGRYDAQLLEFARIVRGEISNPFGYEHELLLHRCLLAASGYISGNFEEKEQ